MLKLEITSKIPNCILISYVLICGIDFIKKLYYCNLKSLLESK